MTWTQRKKKLKKKIGTETATTPQHIDYEVFTDVPAGAELNEKDIGNKVWVVSEPRTTDCYLVEIHDDHYKVKFKGELVVRALFKNEVIRHPDLWKPKQFTSKK